MLERSDPVNWSTLKAMAVSPKHYLHGLTHPREDTEALLLGRLTHCLVYEPGQVAARYVREPRFHRGQKDETARANGYDGGKESAAAWALANADKDIVPAELWARAEAMAAALASDPIAGPMIRGGYAEQPITWTDAETGIECRGRVDHVNGCLSDLKTSRCVEPRWFASQVARMGYHAQLAYYADGLAANGVILEQSPHLIVIENVEPFDVACLWLSEDGLAAGRRLYRRLLDRLAECRTTGRWPGVADGRRQQIALPAWATEQSEPELTMGGVAIEI